MKITFEIDTERTHAQELRSYRAAAAYLLHLTGDLKLDEEETSAEVVPKIPQPPRHEMDVTPRPKDATAPGIASNAAPVAGIVPPPPAIVPPAIASNFIPPPPPSVPTGTNSDEGDEPADPPSNVVNFPSPPPLPPANTAVPPASSIPATTAAAVSTVASANAPAVEVDKAGMPYDTRIHQKSGNKKKDGTWKLIKGIDPAIVAAVTAELAATKAAAPASGTVLLPPVNTVPMPPPPPIPAAIGVPAPPVTSSVPVPPVAAVGGVGGSAPTFRELIDKITAATHQKLITPQDVSRLCQHRGAPNLMQLNAMPELLPKITADVDAILAGLSVDAVIAGLG